MRAFTPSDRKIGHGHMVRCTCVLAELYADFFSRHASPLEIYVFMAVANRGKDVMPDEIFRRFNGK